METIIQTIGLYHEYPNGVQAIRNVNLEIHAGEYIALIGKNGSGKSTLVKHFNGLLRPTKGKVMVGGMDTAATRSEHLAKRVGYVFQNPDYMLFATTVEQEVRFGPKNLKLDSEEINKRVEQALEVTGLAKQRNESPLFFGKGMRRMITIASILSMNPDVMIIDEPTTGMDFRGREAVMTLIDRLNQLGKTIIIITHDMKVVAAHSKRVIVMSDGIAILDCPTRELYNHEKELSLAALKPPERVRLAEEVGLNTDNAIPTVEDIVAKLKQLITEQSPTNSQTAH